MKASVAALGVLLAASMGAWAAAENDDGGPSAADAARILKSSPGTFVLTIEYRGAQDSKAPRQSFTLATQPARWTATRLHHFNLMADKTRVAALVDALRKDGFLDEAVRSVPEEQESTAKFDAPCYRLAVTGGGVLCEVNLGWGAGLVGRLRRLSAAFERNDEPVSMGIGVVLQSLPDLRAAWAAETKAKLAGDLDHFMLSLSYAGPLRTPTPSALMISTQPMEYAKSLTPHFDAVVSKEEALKILDWLEKRRFFEQAKDASDRKPAYPAYVLAVSGGGVRLVQEMQFGPQVVWEAKAIKGLVNARAGEQADKFVAELAESTKTPAERNKETLVANVKDFHFAIQHTGAKGDAKNPFWSMVLSTAPIEQLAKPSAQFQVIIDEKQALKIIDFLWSDGFFWRAVQDIPKDGLVSSYYVQVAAGGMRLEDDLGWGAPLVARLEIIRAALDGEAAAAMDKVIAPLRERVKAEEKQAAAERGKVVAALKARLAGDLDGFVMSFYGSGPDPKKRLYSLTISTRPIEYNARAEDSLDAVISKPEALKVLDWLEENGFFAQAEPEMRARPRNLCYFITVRGAGLNLTGPIGWADEFLAKLDALKMRVNADAGKQIDQLARPVKEIADALAAERIPKFRENLDKVSLQFSANFDHGSVNAPTLRFVQGKFNAGEVSWTAVIDPKQAGRIVDFLAKDGYFGRAVVTVEPKGSCYTLGLGGPEWLQTNLGEGETLIRRLEALRGALEGDAAAKMDTFLARVKDWTEHPKPGPVLVSEARMKKLNDERAEILRKNIDSFSLGLRYCGQAEKPFYRIALHVFKDRIGGRDDGFSLERVIDRQTAAALIDYLHDSGALGRAEERDPHAEKRFTRADPPGPCYELGVNGGIWLVLNFGWEKPMLDNLLGIRKCLDGDAAADMDTLLGRLNGYIEQWTGKRYEPPA